MPKAPAPEPEPTGAPQLRHGNSDGIPTIAPAGPAGATRIVSRGGFAADRILRIARRNLRLIIICIIVAPGVAFALSALQEKQYTATASLLFRDPQVDQNLFGNSSLTNQQDPTRAAATNLKLARSEVVAARTATALGTGLTAAEVAEKVDVEPQGESDLVSVAATDHSPAFSAHLANTFGEQFIAFRRDADRAQIREAQDLVRHQRAALPAEQATSTVAKQLQQREQKLDELAALQTGNVELTQPATIPSSPSVPKTTRNVALGILLGIVLAIGLILLREQLDRRLRDEDDIAEVFDLPVLASVPESRLLERGPKHERSPSGRSEAESFAMLRANLLYFNVDRDIRSILVTSAAPRDGKTTVSWYLATAEARAGEKVLYIEADLRRPALAQRLGVPNPATGLSQVLVGRGDTRSAVAPSVVRVENVDVLFAGPVPPNPAALIESTAMVNLLRAASATYDRVIVDTPPVGVVADAIPLVSSVSGVVVVVRDGQTDRNSAMHLRDQLAHYEAPVLGVVINGSAPRKTEYFSYGPASEESGDEAPSGLSARVRQRSRGRHATRAIGS